MTTEQVLIFFLIFLTVAVLVAYAATKLRIPYTIAMVLVGLGVSILSYAGQVRLGVATDAGLVPDPETIVEAFHDEMQSMMAE